MAILKNIGFWEKLLEDMPNAYRKWFAEEKKYFTEHVPVNARVLEVGCGNGRSLKDLLDITQNLFGVDHDEKAIEDAKNNFKDYPNIKFEFAEADDLPYENEFFDVVTCMGTFANFGDKKYAVLKEMKRVLKDDGFIIISVFSEDAFEERMKVYKTLKVPIKETRGTTVIFAEELVDNTSEQFTKGQLLDIFAEAKLNAVDIKKKGIAYLCKLKKVVPS